MVFWEIQFVPELCWSMWISSISAPNNLDEGDQLQFWSSVVTAKALNHVGSSFRYGFWLMWTEWSLKHWKFHRKNTKEWTECSELSTHISGRARSRTELAIPADDTCLWSSSPGHCYWSEPPSMVFGLCYMCLQFIILGQYLIGHMTSDVSACDLQPLPEPHRRERLVLQQKGWWADKTAIHFIIHPLSVWYFCNPNF